VRFGVLDSLPLLHTGVVSALQVAFSKVQLPEDFQKIDRLINAAALVWWRKHRAYHTASGYSLLGQTVEPVVDVDFNQQRKFAGLALLQYLSNSQVLSQLMFSTVMLHQTIHGDGTGARGAMSFEEWSFLNRGLEDTNKDVPDFVQRPIYDEVNRNMMSELLVPASLVSGGTQAVNPSSTEALEEGKAIQATQARSAKGNMLSSRQLDDTIKEDLPSPRTGSALQSLAKVEGWIKLLGRGSPLIRDPLSSFDDQSLQLGSEALGMGQDEASLPQLAASEATHEPSSTSRSLGAGVGLGKPLQHLRLLLRLAPWYTMGREL